MTTKKTMPASAIAGRSAVTNGAPVACGTRERAPSTVAAATIDSAYWAALNHARWGALRARRSASAVAAHSATVAASGPPSISTANAKAVNSVISPSAPRRKTRIGTKLGQHREAHERQDDRREAVAQRCAAEGDEQPDGEGAGQADGPDIELEAVGGQGAAHGGGLREDRGARHAAGHPVAQ